MNLPRTFTDTTAVLIAVAIAVMIGFVADAPWDAIAYLAAAGFTIGVMIRNHRGDTRTRQ